MRIGNMVAAAERAFLTLVSWLAMCAALLLLGVVALICADVILRNASIPGLPTGLAASNELTEQALYISTLLTAPYLLVHGLHVRVDVLLKALPKEVAWGCEWVSDVLMLGCCLVLVGAGVEATIASYVQGSLVIRTLVTPEWWILAPLPVCFALLAVGTLLRMRKLRMAPKGPREDTVSAS